MRNLCFLLFLVAVLSCKNLKLADEDNNTTDIVAIANTSKLFEKDIEQILPKNINSKDSAVFVKSYINNWAIQEILIANAEKNISQSELNTIQNLVNDYKSSLLINNYKQKLIHQRLDTIILDDEIQAFYNNSKENFKLNEELVKLKYIRFNKNIISKDDFIKLFKSSEIEDAEELEKRQLSFKTFQLNDSVWKPLDNIMLKLPFSKDNLLKKTKFITKQDSIDLYLVAVKDVLLRNDVAPLSYVKPKIKQIILHKRKIELIKEIEKILLKDAIKNNNFKIY